MTPQQQPISDEEFATLLARPYAESTGPGTDKADATVDDAAARDLRQALRSYRQETLHWAERRSAGQPSLAILARRQERWAALPRWSLALVALVTIAGGVAHLAGSADTADQPLLVLDASASPMDRPSTTADIEADNLLLSSIDAELSYHAASPVDSLHLQKHRQESETTARSGVND